jgi:hypothetical protein
MAQTILFLVLVVAFFMLPAASITFGVLASSFWVGALTFFGILMALSAMGVVTDDKRYGFPKEYFIIYGLSIACLAGASLIAGYQPLWIVFVTWGLIVIAGVFTSDFAYKELDSLGHMAAWMAILAAPVAVTVPMIIQSVVTSQPIDPASWSWAITAAGLAALMISLNLANRSKHQTYFVYGILGLVLISVSMWLSETGFSWWWAIIWVLAALIIGYGGYTLPKWRNKTGSIGIAIGVVCALVGVGVLLVSLGVVSPNWLDRSERTEVAVAKPGATLSALDISSTQLAAAQATATQAYLEEFQQEGLRQTQTVQAVAELQTQGAFTQSAADAAEQTQAAQHTQAAQPDTLADTSQGQGPGFFNAIGGFLWMAVRSVWGVLYLLVFFLIGQTWIKKWGGILFLGLLLVAVGYFGGRSDYHAGLYQALINSGPKTWLISIMSTSYNISGTIGWGIVAASIGMGVLLIPGFKATIAFSQKSTQAMAIKENQGTTVFQNYLQSGGLSGRTTLAYFLFLLITPTFTIALWMALRAMATSQMAKSPFLSIPNLTVPHWRPVWQWPYFILGLVFLIIYLVYLSMQRKEQLDNPFFKMSNGSAVVVAIVATLLFPAGVVLFYAAFLLFLSLAYPIISANLKEQARQSQPQPQPTPYWQVLEEQERWRKELEEQEQRQREMEEQEQRRRKLEEQERKRREQEEQKEIHPVLPELPGQKVYQTASPIVGGLLKGTNQLCLVNQAGELYFLQNGLVLNIVKLPFASPKYLLTAKNDQGVIIGQRGELVEVSAGEEIEIKSPIQLSSGLEACALNGFGTMVAYAPLDQPHHLKGLFLANQREMDFPNPGDEKIRSLTFSESGRYLGMGTEMGKLVVIDVATHTVINSVPDMGFGPLELLDVVQDSQWIAVYRDGWLGSWLLQVEGGIDAINQTLFQSNPVELANGFSSMAVDKARQRILIGDPQGYLWIYPFDLRTQEYSKKVQDGKISQIFINPDGTVITVGDRTQIRMLSDLP